MAVVTEEVNKCNTGLSSQGRAKLRGFCGETAQKSTQPSPSLTRKPCTFDKNDPARNFQFRTHGIGHQAVTLMDAISIFHEEIRGIVAASA